MAATKEPTPFELVAGIRKKIRKLDGDIALQADKLKGLRAELKTQQTLLANTIDQEGQVNLFSETVANGTATAKAKEGKAVVGPKPPKKVGTAWKKEPIAAAGNGLTQKDVDALFAAGIEKWGDLAKARDGGTLGQVQSFTKAMGQRCEQALHAFFTALAPAPAEAAAATEG